MLGMIFMGVERGGGGGDLFGPVQCFLDGIFPSVFR